MNFETQIIAIAAGALVAVTLAALLGRYQNRKNRELIDYLGQRVEDLEDAVASGQTRLESESKGFTEQVRRIAWLEAKIRKPDVEDEDAVIGQDVPANRPNITERRHRVLKLAARGHDAPTIAKTLGMMSGEVELIMNLKRAAAAA
jgi:hypothetical protein